MNQRIIQQFLKDGKETEKQFAQLLVKREGGNIVFSSQQTDIEQHVDLTWHCNHYPQSSTPIEMYIKIDVKGLKKSSRSGEVDENIHWIELRNVSGKQGWLFGEADMFAFETIDYWILVPKKQLQLFIKDKIKNEKEVVNDNSLLYKIYQRSGRQDMIVKVKTIDLMAIAKKIIKK